MEVDPLRQNQCGEGKYISLILGKLVNVEIEMVQKVEVFKSAVCTTSADSCSRDQECSVPVNIIEHEGRTSIGVDRALYPSKQAVCAVAHHSGGLDVCTEDAPRQTHGWVEPYRKHLLL